MQCWERHLPCSYNGGIRVVYAHTYNVHWVTFIFTSRPVCDIWLFAAKGVVVH